MKFFENRSTWSRRIFSLFRRRQSKKSHSAFLTEVPISKIVSSRLSHKSQTRTCKSTASDDIDDIEMQRLENVKMYNKLDVIPLEFPKKAIASMNKTLNAIKVRLLKT